MAKINIEGTVTISKQEYYELRRDSEMLMRLEGGGVDNWEGYDSSIHEDHEESLDEFEARLKKEIEEKS